MSFLRSREHSHPSRYLDDFLSPSRGLTPGEGSILPGVESGFHASTLSPAENKFSFNERDRQRMEDKEKKLDQLRNPDIDKRGEQKLQRWKQQIKEEQKQQKEMTAFKARPNTVTNQEPFVPKKDSRMLSESLSGSIVQENFELATERRARERQEFEKHLAEKETEKCLMEEEERRLQEEREKEELNRLRHELVHKAQPVKKFNHVDVKTSDVPLTVPKTPKFSDRFKF
ncbi:unnamed protein product [Ranitomeya imitator]|uniref:TPX2 C-terminal domain-containing protein n=1 Tax=Ranitomeya imitator TaxID=111125 RepID=A0ABN9KYU1_9NEOB|nr:unnamed protein product [Ranitomeya imitator]